MSLLLSFALSFVMEKIIKFILLYFAQAACLWIGVEASSSLQGDALKVFLQGYWIYFYAMPLLPTIFIFRELHDVPLLTILGCSERQCVEAYREGKAAWQYNQFAYFIHRRWMLYLLVASICFFLILHTAFLPRLDAVIQSAIILALTFLFFGSNLIVFRQQTIRFLDAQHILHQLAHRLRNEHSLLLKKFAGKEKASPEDSLRHLREALDLAREYVRIITKTKNVDLALRVALPHQEEQGNVMYHLLARTDGLQENSWLKESLPANEGIPRYLIEARDTCSVLVYRNMKEAMKEKLFPEAEDEAIIKEVGSLAITPLKAWDGKKKSMIGMVYLVSREKKAFREEHIDAIRFLADILSDALASSVTVNHMLIMKGNKNARRRQLLEKY
ncbi:MAG: hypothetical protein Q3M24_17445 [Candidatus Electrothrix aestuarii]|uniref:GAF domain-containing protein n=1 Tax=Candidatus Electrothrix aestuarii TaxID=3062594 RepID=A0AAU8LRZ8_9BACT|nr:hypothetical protein [Candidatus Electrothrix aestuarii]